MSTAEWAAESGAQAEAQSERESDGKDSRVARRALMLSSGTAPFYTASPLGRTGLNQADKKHEKQICGKCPAIGSRREGRK